MRFPTRTFNSLIILSTFLTIFSLYPQQSKAEEGPSGSSGGNKSSSSSVEVMHALTMIDMKSLFFEIFKDRHKIKDSMTLAVLNKMFGPDQLQNKKKNISFAELVEKEKQAYEASPIFEKLKNVPIQPLIDEACEDKNSVVHDACATSDKVYLSVTRLMKTPPHALINEIAAILAHEYTHVMNFGETEAKNIQNFFLRNGKRLFYRSDDISLIINELKELRRQLPYIANRIEQIPSTRLNSCSQLNYFSGKLSLITKMIEQKEKTYTGQWGERYKTTKDQYYESLFIEEALHKLAYVCQRSVAERLNDQNTIKGDQISSESLALNIKNLDSSIKELLKSFDIELN